MNREINLNDNGRIMEEIYRLIANQETDGSIYLLSDDQKNAAKEGQLQFKNSQFLKSQQADNEIEKWLGK
jgi:hypothetical protein